MRERVREREIEIAREREREKQRQRENKIDRFEQTLFNKKMSHFKELKTFRNVHLYLHRFSLRGVIAVSIEGVPHQNRIKQRKLTSVQILTIPLLYLFDCTHRQPNGASQL